MENNGLTDADITALNQGEFIMAIDGQQIPKALYPTTDQANLQRLADKFGSRLFFSAGFWHAWDGTRWAINESEVYKYACQLSDIILSERKTADEKLSKELVKWAKKSEMRGSIEGVVALGKKVLVMAENQLDSDPWLLNCHNGTIDLRTSELKPHNPDNYITKMCNVKYDRHAKCEFFLKVIARVCLEEDRTTKAVVNFIQRWFGYCCTGSVREQKILVHWGSGSNGKSTILDIIAHLLGDYACTAAPGLLVSTSNDRHSCEIADLFNKRMVTAHETSEGGVLREDFVKQATGGDKLKARFMRENFFEFAPTHKLQLLTNHKPTIKGQDHAIWRRVLLVPYHASFGDLEDVAMGFAKFIKEPEIFDNLLKEKEGIFAWLIEGARQWFLDGLQPPEVVLNASKDYKTEQDRVLQFIKEECIIGIDYSEQLYGKKEERSLLKVYTEWCSDNAFKALGRNKFGDAIERIVAGAHKSEKKVNISGKMKDRIIINGLKLKEENI